MIRADEALGTARARCNCCCMMSTHIVECMDLLLLIFANQVPYIPQPATQCKLDSLIRIISKNHLRYAYFEEDCAQFPAALVKVFIVAIAMVTTRQYGRHTVLQPSSEVIARLLQLIHATDSLPASSKHALHFKLREITTGVPSTRRCHGFLDGLGTLKRHHSSPKRPISDAIIVCCQMPRRGDEIALRTAMLTTHCDVQRSTIGKLKSWCIT
jgi:hypothetical protein